MKFRRKEVVDAEQWFPGKNVPGVFIHQPEPARLHDRMGGFHDYPQDPYPAVRQSDGKVFRVSPGDWVIADFGGKTHRTMPDDIFTDCYEQIDPPKAE
jgi:hypothetical protein